MSQSPRVMLASLVGLLLASSPAPAAAQQQSDARFESVRAYIQEIMEESDLPSVAVAVARDGEIIWDEGFGYANLEERIPTTTETMYSLASISKPMTATALMQLVEDGRVDLDQPANAYLGAGKIHSPEWDASGATVERVLSHTAGLPLHWEFFYEGEDHPRRSTDEGIDRFGVLVTPPGAVYQYSNLGFGIIERIVELETGRDYAEYMEAEIFEPLGMPNSTVSTGGGLGNRAAVRYDSNNEPVPYYDFDHRGGSAVYASARDLARFGAYHLGDTPEGASAILDESTIEDMQRQRTPTEGSGYALGWLTSDDDHGYQRVSHTGGMPGVSTGLYLYPAEDIAIAVLTNRSNRYVGRIAQEIASVVLPGYAEALAAENADQDNGDEEGFDAPASLLGEWSGEVHAGGERLPVTLTVKPEGDIHVKLGDEMPTLLSYAEWNEGQLTGRFAGAIPGEDSGRHSHIVQLNLYLRDSRLVGSATAITDDEPAYFALTSFVQLERAAGQ